MDNLGNISRTPHAKDEDYQPIVLLTKSSLDEYAPTEADAAYIAATNPQVVLGLIDKLKRLEKEADWLAERLQTICRHDVPDVCAMLDIRKCPFFANGKIFTRSCTLKCKTKPVKWREAARKAVEKANGTDRH